jgi:hypothetical protein
MAQPKPLSSSVSRSPVSYAKQAPQPQPGSQPLIGSAASSFRNPPPPLSGSAGSFHENTLSSQNSSAIHFGLPPRPQFPALNPTALAIEVALSLVSLPPLPPPPIFPPTEAPPPPRPPATSHVNQQPINVLGVNLKSWRRRVRLDSSKQSRSSKTKSKSDKKSFLISWLGSVLP